LLPVEQWKIIFKQGLGAWGLGLGAWGLGLECLSLHSTDISHIVLPSGVNTERLITIRFWKDGAFIYLQAQLGQTSTNDLGCEYNE